MKAQRFSRSTGRRPADLAAVAAACIVCLLSLLAAILWYTGAWAAEGVVLELKPAASADAERVTISTVASLVSGDESLWDQLAGEALCLAPVTGTQACLTAQDILGILAKRGYDWRAVAFTGAERVTVTAAGQTVPPQAILDLVASACAAKLGVIPALELKQELLPVNLPAGELKLTVRFPAKDGVWLPDAVECQVGGRLAAVVPLLRYLDLRLPVVVALDGIPARARILAGQLGLEERVLAPGLEVVTRVEDAVGLTTRSGFAKGAMLKLSRLILPFDVPRGMEVTLIINNGGVQLSARARALNSAYIGQSLLVERLDDGMKFTGLVYPGPQVVVQ